MVATPQKVAAKKEEVMAAHQKKIKELLTQVQQFVMEATTPCHSQDVLRFLRMYPVLCDELERITSAEIPDVPELDVSDIREFVALYTDMDKQMAEWNNFVKIKDAMIWQLLKDREDLESEIRDLTKKFGAASAKAVKEAEMFEERAKRYAALLDEKGIPYE